MSLIIKNKNSNTSSYLKYKSTSDEYTCIGSYEDKPTNCVYYFLHSNDNMGVAGKYDCIVEYNQLDDKTRLVYQDGRPGSNGATDQILNFSKSHLITGVNKVEDFLYWTDNLNRPRKIDVEKSKRNEEYIKLGPTFQGILKQSLLGDELITDNTWEFINVNGSNTINGESSPNTYTSSDGSFRFITGSSSPIMRIKKSNIVEANKYYQLSYDITSSSHSNSLITDTADENGQEQIRINTTVGSHTTTFYSKNTYFMIKRGNDNIDITISNISLRETSAPSNNNNVFVNLSEQDKTILIGVSNNHPFLKNDHLYLHQRDTVSPSEEGRGYNGYCKSLGIIKPFDDGTSNVSVQEKSKTLTAQGTNPTRGLDRGDYICIVKNSIAYVLEVDYIISDSTLQLTKDSPITATQTTSFNLTSFNSNFNTNNGIITNTPFIDNYPTSDGGKILMAEPDDAYSPLVSYGAREDKIKYFDALSHQPRHKPSFDFSKTSSTLNHLLGKFFQFRYRYVYKDGSVSAYSGISDVANQDVYAAVITHTDSNAMNTILSNVINVNYSDDVSVVDKVEVVARDGNNGEFFLISTVKNDFIKYLKKRKNEDLFSTPALFFGGQSQTNVAFSKLKFTNDSVYPFMDPVDLGKLQDHLPKRAKAQTILPKNRIAYGNVVDGYDNTSICCDMSFESSEFISGSKEDLSTPTLSVVSLGSPISNTVLKFDFNLATLDTFDGSVGSKELKIDLEWNKLLFQHHGLGDFNSSVVPRGGGFNCSVVTFSPQTIDDIGENAVNVINNLDTSFESSNFYGSVSRVPYFYYSLVEGTIVTRKVDTSPSSFSASYSDGVLSINFTYNAGTNESIDQGFHTYTISYGNSGTLPHSDTVAYSASDDFNLLSATNSGSSYIFDNSTYKTAAFFGRSYKAGANHAFGLVYYDETNRASFVNISKPANDFNSGTKIYSPFYSEKNVPQNYFNKVNWKIYHRPPVWATHYQWVYSGNTSVDEFIQIPIQAAYKGNSENKIYLSLGALKGSELSYNEENPSLIDYQFVEGDRVRFISFGGNDKGDEDERKYFKEYIDVPISSVEGPLDQNEVEAVTQSAGADPVSGFFIVIKNPADSTNVVEFSSANSTSSSYQTADISHTNLKYVDSEEDDGTINGYHKLVVEIYRPKKIVEGEDSGSYYEVGHKMEVQNPGTGSRTHQGQSDNFFFDEESGMEVTAKNTVSGIVDVNGNPTTNYASGVLESGDTYTRTRRISHYKANESTPRVLTELHCEDYYLNDFFESNNWNKGRLNVENSFAEERRLSASVYYSDTYSSTTNYNGLSTFNMDDEPFYDYNQDFGSIQSLMIRNDDLIIFHENKIGRALVGKNILKYADGDSNLALSSNVLGDYAQVYSGNNGCSLNPESIVKYKDRFYFVDIKRGAVLRLGGDGLTRISDYGLSDYVRDLGEVYIMTNPEESTNGEFKIVAGYDPKYDEYVVTFPYMLDYNDSKDSGLWGSTTSNWEASSPLINNLQPERSLTSKTISFNDNIKKWTSFYSYKPEFYGRINRQFLTYKNGRLYKQNSSNSSNFNTFYGVRYNSNIEFPFNAEPSSVKSYNAISLESDTKLLTDVSTNMGQYNNSYDSVISTEIGYRSINGYVYSEDDSPYCLYGKPGVNFYEDVSPGDLIKININKTPRYNIVKSILTKNKITLDSPLSSVFDDQTAEVIDYKTKEGIQYSQIPFAPSKTDVDYRGNFQSENSGDASNIFGLGTYRANINNRNKTGVIENVQGSIPFVGNKLIRAVQQIPGAKYESLGSLSFPLEYSLYSLNNDTGESSHAGWVYDITTNNDVKFKIVGSNNMINFRSVFYFIVREGLIDGEKLKGHYLKTNLKSHWHQSKYKFNLYGANVDVDKSELSNK